jgi:hypothetical protein
LSGPGSNRNPGKDSNRRKVCVFISCPPVQLFLMGNGFAAWEIGNTCELSFGNRESIIEQHF